MFMKNLKSQVKNKLWTSMFCLFSFLVFEISKFKQKINQKLLKNQVIYMFMTNFKVVCQKTTQLWLFFVMCVLCIFAIDKVEISKQIFYKGYFRIRLGMFTANFKVLCQKTIDLWSFYVLCVFCIFVLKRFKFQKNIF